MKKPRRNYMVGFTRKDPQVYCFGVTYTELMTRKEAFNAIGSLTNVPSKPDMRRVFRLVPLRRAKETKP